MPEKDEVKDLALKTGRNLRRRWFTYIRIVNRRNDSGRYVKTAPIEFSLFLQRTMERSYAPYEFADGMIETHQRWNEERLMKKLNTLSEEERTRFDKILADWLSKFTGDFYIEVYPAVSSSPAKPYQETKRFYRRPRK